MTRISIERIRKGRKEAQVIAVVSSSQVHKLDTHEGRKSISECLTGAKFEGEGSIFTCSALISYKVNPNQGPHTKSIEFDGPIYVQSDSMEVLRDKIVARVALVRQWIEGLTVTERIDFAI